VLTRTRLTHFARHVLRPADHVALEANTNCWAVAAVLKPHVARVVVSNPLVTKAIAQAEVKTDKVDARVLAQLLRCDFPPEVWYPDTAAQQMRLHPGPLEHSFRRLKQTIPARNVDKAKNRKQGLTPSMIADLGQATQRIDRERITRKRNLRSRKRDLTPFSR